MHMNIVLKRFGQPYIAQQTAVLPVLTVWTGIDSRIWSMEIQVNPRLPIIYIIYKSNAHCGAFVAEPWTFP